MPAHLPVLVLVSVLGFPSLSTSAARHEPDNPDRTFAAELAAARLDPEHVDFRRLRHLFAATSEFDPAAAVAFDPAPVEYELKNGERAAALVALDRALAGRWTDIAAHDYAITACEKTGFSDRARLHRAFLDGLARSILDSGDGRTPETAWHVISEAEEALLLHALHCRLEKCVTLEHHGQALHRLTARDTRDGRSFEIYVNVDIPHRWHERHAHRRQDNPSP
jgi:hypothetical protein